MYLRCSVSLAALAVLFSVAAVDGAVSTAGLQSTQCVSSSNSSDIYATKSTVKYATGFTIAYHNTYKVVENKTTNSTYVLYQCGSAKPSSVKDVSAYIPVPVNSSAAWATSAAIFLEALGVQNTVKNLGTAPSLVSACLQELLQDVITPFNDGNSTDTDHQEQSNDVVFNMPGGEDTNTTNTVYSTEYLESSALGRSEWVKFFGAFFNAEERANKLFDAIDTNYQCFASKADKEYNDIRPVIAWTSYAGPTQYNNNTAYWQISFADYKYDIVRDAGARMLNTTGKQSTMFSTSQAFLRALKDVDIIIDESFVSYNYSALMKNYGIADVKQATNYSWVATGRVFRPDRVQSTSGGLGWFEAPVAFADALLQDLVGVAHPKFAKDGYKPIWFRNLAKSDPVTVVTASNCTDMYAQRQDPAGVCASIDFQSANPSDSDYSDVEQSRTQDLIYDVSKSEVVNDGSLSSSSSSNPISVGFFVYSALMVAIVIATL
ncbi:hypothetical protein IWW38_003170 [Coemansia aciculifera]|uniref:Uncharacterized protein n=1 Tax=Coemansia aciculifera TaxID=417176 RepID=A0ACC1M274_9FUNG|nr:hypothetical protein IWW38_003170 [Coemansia aciculifera]